MPVVVALACVARITTADEAALLSRLNDEAPKIWEELLDATNHLSVRAEFTQVELNTGEELEQSDMELVVADWNALVRGKWGGGNAERHIVENEQYRFEVEQRGSEWFMTDLSPFRHRAKTFKEERDELFRGRVMVGGNTARGLTIKAACKGLLLYNAWLPRMVTTEGFEVQRVAECDKGVRIEFLYELKQRQGNDAIGSGFVILDPQRSWQIVESTVAAKWGLDPAKTDIGTITFVNEFNDLKPARVRRQFLRIDARSAAGEPIKTELKWTYEFKPVQSVDSTAFTTAAYGIADPEEDRPRRWLLPILTGSILCGLLVWYIGNHLRDRRARAV